MLAKLEPSEAVSTQPPGRGALATSTSIGMVLIARQVSSRLYSSDEELWETPEIKAGSDKEIRVSQALPILVGAHLAHDASVLEHGSWKHE